MCIFCNIINKKQEAFIVYEDVDVIAFLDNDPINEGHVLLVPKNHYLDIDDIPQDELSHLMITAQLIVKSLKKIYKPSGYSIMQNGGIFNDIGHFHLHIFPRYSNDGFKWIYSTQKINFNKQISDNIKAELEKNNLAN